jgi:hypothetical protein
MVEWTAEVRKRATDIGQWNRKEGTLVLPRPGLPLPGSPSLRLMLLNANGKAYTPDRDMLNASPHVLAIDTTGDLGA